MATKKRPFTRQVDNPFQTFAALLDCADKARARGRSDGVGPSAGQAWDFGAGFDQAMDLARNGWPDGAARVRALADKLVAKVAPVLTNTGLEYRDDGGPLIDVGRYCEGEPEHYLEFAPAIARKPVTLAVHVGATADVAAEQMFFRGAAVLAAVEILRARGFVVTVVGANYGTLSDRTIYGFTFPVAVAGDTVDGDAIAFACAHPAVHRRIGFAVREVLWNTYGGDFESNNPATLPDADVYEGALTDSSAFASEESAAARVLEICKQAGCEITESAI